MCVSKLSRTIKDLWFNTATPVVLSLCGWLPCLQGDGDGFLWWVVLLTSSTRKSFLLCDALGEAEATELRCFIVRGL